MFTEWPRYARDSRRCWDITTTKKGTMAPTRLELITEANVANVLGIVLQFMFNKSYSRNKKKLVICIGEEEIT